METTEKTTSRVDSAGDVLSGKLKDLLAEKENVVIQVEIDCIVAAAARKMRDNKVGALMVMKNDTLSGIFTERDLMSRVVAEGLDPEKVQVSVVNDLINCHSSIGNTHPRSGKYNVAKPHQAPSCA